MATFTLNPKFFPEVKQRSAIALKAAVLQLSANVKAQLANATGGQGNRYDWYKHNLWPLDKVVRFFTRGGIVRPMKMPDGGWQVRGRIHQVSAVGQAPRLLTGTLSKSVAWRMGLESAGDVVAQVGSNLIYGRVLEERMKRPAWEPTLRKSMPMLNQIFAETYRRAA